MTDDKHRAIALSAHLRFLELYGDKLSAEEWGSQSFTFESSGSDPT